MISGRLIPRRLSFSLESRWLSILFFFLIFRSWFFDFPDPCQLPIGEGLGVVIGPLFFCYSYCL
jgi:hypothetical protein